MQRRLLPKAHVEDLLSAVAHQETVNVKFLA